ncbi:proton-conducting transporter membrane subunit [Pelagicoccus sp. SDUM812003]|uniref:complex I subunit 5 family protein n=1 Tax=Pelagicoccus sp. SDUM812003 TaxID=3041267 RepID=UPI00280CC4B8|nr:proton-conducting transporter membrane subunit [Pelagicoccus sp. SDUM812003]MDQ8202062.1 proton-conducting transporter membrane subunit [Pelagicoccus sp. SDUM812003]
MIAQHLPALPILLYLFLALLMPLAGKIARGLPATLAWLGSTVVACLGGYGLWLTATQGPIHYEMGNWAPPIGIELIADPLSCFFTFAIGAVSAFVLLHSRESVERDVGGRSIMPYYASALLLLAGFSGIVGTGDLFNLYVFLEISALAGYAVLGCGSPKAALSSFRYLIIGTIGASFYLLGIGLLLANTGSLNMGDVAEILRVTGLDSSTVLAVVFILVGLGIKMALLPLHYWLPDVYTNAPATSTALVAPLGTKVAAYALLRLGYEVLPYEALAVDLRVFDVVLALGAVGIIWGSVMAIAQDNLKRMLAYSSVAQIGYIAVGFGLATPYGYIGAVLHVINHAVMKACLFLVTANLERQGHGISIKGLNASLRRKMPVTCACFALASISMIGLPPAAGFFSKWYLLLGSYEQGSWAIIVVIVISSLLNAVYFFRVLEKMYLGKDDESETASESSRLPIVMSVSTLALALSLLVLGFGNVVIVSKFISPMLPGF